MTKGELLSIDYTKYKLWILSYVKDPKKMKFEN